MKVSTCNRGLATHMWSVPPQFKRFLKPWPSVPPSQIGSFLNLCLSRNPFPFGLRIYLSTPLEHFPFPMGKFSSSTPACLAPANGQFLMLQWTLWVVCSLPGILTSWEVWNKIGLASLTGTKTQSSVLSLLPAISFPFYSSSVNTPNSLALQ